MVLDAADLHEHAFLVSDDAAHELVQARAEVGCDQRCAMLGAEDDVKEQVCECSGHAVLSVPEQGERASAPSEPEDNRMGDEMSFRFHGFRDAQGGVAPTVATRASPFGAQ